jgi:hypothetical protein
MKLPNVPENEYAPSKLETNCSHSWFNRYGGYIIETKWDPIKKNYEEIYHNYNMPNLDLMPTK